MSLTEFLLARITEDEQNWRRLARDDEFREVVLLGCVIQADRVLAGCEAKRRIVEVNSADTWAAAHVWMPAQTLRLLGLPYADHPDYREEWRP
jgi:hypothetical protein